MREKDINLHTKNREIENAVEIPFKKNILKVKRIEDVLARKIRRLKGIARVEENGLNSLEQSLYQLAEDGKWDDLSKIPLTGWLDSLVIEQNKVMGTEGGKRSLTKQYTFGKHAYDVCLMARKISGESGLFNRAYFVESKRLVETLSRLG